MTRLLLPPPPAVALPATDGTGAPGLFAVRRVFCVGRNYAAHAREMGGDPSREAPFFFMKPADALLPCAAPGASMPYPPATADLQHEVELVAAIGAGGADIAPADAPAHVWGYGCGLDMTRRDLQAEAKRHGQPWDMAKGFDHAAPIGSIAAAAAIGHPARGRIALSVNGAVRQEADLADMVWSVAEIVAALSRLVRLAPGDLVFTGTPAGVGAVRPGDRLEGMIEGVGGLAVSIAPPAVSVA